MSIRKILTRRTTDTDFESGIQIRDTDPANPVDGQLWLNSTTNILKYRDGNSTVQITARADTDSPLGDLVVVPANNIDWNSGFVYERSISSNITLTFSNLQSKTIFLLIKNTGLGTVNVTMPVGLKYDFAATSPQFSLPVGEYLILKLHRVNTTVHVEKVSQYEAVSFPNGSNGNLTILNGQTINLAAGSLRDYNNVTINAGGTLNIDGSGGGAITELYINNLICNGNIVGRRFGGGGTWNRTTVLNEALSYSITQRNAGAGGKAYGPTDRAGAGGAGGASGYGGGGGGVMAAYNPGKNMYRGGPGGTGGGAGAKGQGPVPGAGGAGNSTLGNGSAGVVGPTSPNKRGWPGGPGGGSGGGGGAAAPSNNPGRGGSGGGGGGYKGRHGLGLFLYVYGSCSGTGTIFLNGSNGFAGGAGTRRSIPSYHTFSGGFVTGGGGGGGAGGSGGRLWVRQSGTIFTSSSIVRNVNAGVGGGGGSSPTPQGGDFHPKGPNGVAGGGGASGDAGSQNISSI